MKLQINMVFTCISPNSRKNKEKTPKFQVYWKNKSHRYWENNTFYWVVRKLFTEINFKEKKRENSLASPITQKKCGLSEIRGDFSQNNLLSVYNMCRFLTGGHLTTRMNQIGQGALAFMEKEKQCRKKNSDQVITKMNIKLNL